MKFCANLSFMFKKETPLLLDRYALAKEAGFKAVESAFPADHSVAEVREAKEAAGVEQILINMKADPKVTAVTAVPGKESEFNEYLKVTIEYAKAVKARKIHILAGLLDFVTPENWEVYEKNLKNAADVLKKENIMGLIEPINQVTVPKYVLSDYGKAVDIIKRINSPHLRLQLDIFHLQHISGNLTNNIRNLMPYVGHVQIAQAPDRYEPDSDGEINYQYILKLLESCGYDDWVGLEYTPKDNTREGLKWITNFGYSL